MIRKRDIPLNSLHEWATRAGPRTAGQWQPGRSAMESARAWLEAGPLDVPAEIEAIIESHEDFGEIVTWECEPEARVPFDSVKGERSNVDALLTVSDSRGPFVVAVEAKADESFGRTVRGTLGSAQKRESMNPRSKGVARVEQLCIGILGQRKEAEPIKDVRYQLLTVTAAAVAEAKRRSTDRAVVLIHEFVTERTADRRHKQNQAHLDEFVALLSAGTCKDLKPGRLEGPFAVPSAVADKLKVRLYLGKVVRNLRE